MKRTILRYSTYGSITLGVLFVFGMLIGGSIDYSTSEVFGYASMIISLLFVFFGIKHFRDKENEGLVTFKKALVIGVLISIIVAIVFGIIDFIYVKFINPDFMTDYYAYSVEQFRSSLSDADFQAKLEQLEKEKEMFMNPYLTFVVMTMTVFVLGFIISLISSLILQRKN